MAINDFVRRSMQIVGGGIAQSTSNYFDNTVTFINDAKEITDMVIQGGRDAKETFTGMMQGGVGKKFRDWFYNEGGMFMDFDFGDDDDFDAGFEIDSSTGEAKESERVLTPDSMQDIAKKQTGAMYKIAGKTADLHMANTAEIVSAINSRSAELSASINNVNNTLIQIGRRLDMIVEYTSARMKPEDDEKKKYNNSIIGYGGEISLSGLASAIKEKASDSMISSALSMGKNMAGMFTPEMVMSLLLSNTVLSKDFKVLGGKSINDIGEAFNDVIGAGIHTALSNILTSDKLEDLLGDIVSGTRNRDFQRFAENQYNDKPAVFDGMTRKSIVTIIPGYLKEIHKAITNSGGLHIDEKGNLSEKETDHFVNKVGSTMFRTNAISSQMHKDVLKHASAHDINISSRDVYEAGQSLTGSMIYYMYRSGKLLLRPGDISLTSGIVTWAMERALRILTTTSGKDESYWRPVLEHIIEGFESNPVERSNFVKEIQRLYQRMENELTEFAKKDPNNSQAGQIDFKTFLKAYETKYYDYHDEKKPPTQQSTTQQTNSQTNNQASSSITDSSVGSSTGSSSVTNTTYLSGIFQLLNRGINVFVTNKSKRGQQKMFEPISLTALSSLTTTNITSQINTPSSPASPDTSPQPSSFDDDDMTETADDEEEDLSDLSPRERREREKEKKKEAKSKLGKAYNTVKTAVSDWWRGNHKQKGAVFMPWLDAIVPGASDKVQEGVQSIKENETFQNIANSDAVTGVKNTINDVGTKIFGEKTTDESGNEIRTGGIISGVGNEISNVKNDSKNLITGIGDSIASALTSTKTLQNNFNNAIQETEKMDPKSEEDKEDQITAQRINSMAQVMLGDDDVSTQDIQDLQKQINSIHSPKLKRQISTSLVPLLRRSGKKVETGDQVKPTSKLGKIVMMVVAGAKIIFKPILNVLKSVFGVVKNFGKKLLSFLARQLTSGAKMIVYGAQSLGSGMVGMFKEFLGSKMFKGILKIGSTVGKAFTKLGKLMINGFGNIAKAVGGLAKGFGKVVGKVISTPFRAIGRLFNGKKGEDGQSTGGIKEKLSALGDKFRGTSFGAGFMTAFDKSKSDKLRQKQPETVGEQATVDIRTTTDEIKETFIDESNDGKGPFKTLFKILRDHFSKKEEETGGTGGGADGTETTSTTEESNTQKQGGENQGTSTQTGGSENSSKPTGGGGNDGGGTPTPAPTGGGGGGGDAAAAGGEGGDKKKGGAFNLGKMLGGITSMLGGLAKIVLTVVMTLEGFKALQQLVTSVLTSSLKPLNKAFQAIIKAVKPIFKELGGIIHMLAENLVDIINVLIKVISPILSDIVQPVLEALEPVLDIITETLTPILEVLGIILKVVLAPLFGVIKHVILPIIRVIGDAVQVIMGVLQIGMGAIMAILGSVAIGIGGIISAIGKIPGVPSKVGELGGNISDSGKDMQSQGINFMKEGVKAVATGAVNMVIDTASMVLPESLTDKMKEKSNDAINNAVDAGADKLQGGLDTVTDLVTGNSQPGSPEGGSDGSTTNNNIMNTYGSGDTINNQWFYNNTYGSGDSQRSYGSYLNMGKHGCGPMALADAYNRRGGSLGARDLASRMVGTGAYNPNVGTSVSSFMETSKSLGMNVRPGGVTQQSLKRATPNNPVTVIGSGSDYGTRRGNNHYMNVVGTDNHGGAYVSNPLTGRVDRKPISTVAGSAVMGIYGSGDEDGGYSFPDAIKEAFASLKEQANKILGLFTMEDSMEDEVNAAISKPSEDEALRQAKGALGDDYETYLAEAESMGRADYEEKYPKRDGQSDEEYEAAFQKWYEGRKTEYLAKTTIFEDAKEKTSGNDSPWKSILDNYGSEDNEFFTSMESAGNAFYESNKGVSEAAGGGGGAGTVSSSMSGAVMAEFGKPKYTDLDMNDFMNKANHQSGHSLVHSFFGQTNNDTAWTFDGNYYQLRQDPDKEGQGKSGNSHAGLDINWVGGSEGKKLFAITGGKVVRSQGGATPKDGSNGGCGNNVQWQDSGGYYHWYMHMRDDPLVKEGDEIKPGDLIGYVGDTGSSGGAHLHYSVNKSPNASGNEPINPLLYWDTFNPNAGKLVGSNDQERTWAYLTSAGMTPIGAAGLMGCFKYESGFAYNNLENSFQEKFGYPSGAKGDEQYTADVDSGKESEDNFVRGRNAIWTSGQTPGEAVGYGIAQFTSSGLKQGLYDRTVKKGKSISDIPEQLTSIMDVLKERKIYDDINNASSPTEANKLFLWKYEAGTGYTSDDAVLRAYSWMNTNTDGYANAVLARHGAAEDFYNMYSNADITTWEGYGSTDSQIQSMRDFGKTVDSNYAVIGTDINDMNNRKDIYIKAYNDAIKIPGLSSDQIKSEFERVVGTYGITRKQMDADGQVFLQDPGFQSSMTTNDWKFTTYAWAKKNARNWSFNAAPSQDNSNSNSSTKTSGPGVVNNKVESWLNFRSSADSNADILGQLHQGDSVKVISDNGNGWYKIEYDGKTGYASSDYIDITGSGDADPNFWNSYMGWNNNQRFPIEEEIPPVDQGLVAQYETDTGIIPTVINRYNIQRADDTLKEEQIRQILMNTYNVRSESIEALLKLILEELKKKKNPTPTGQGGGSTKLFDEKIPSQVTKLSVG